MIDNSTRVEGVGIVSSTRGREFDAFDALGPLCRRLLNFECRFRWSAEAVLGRFKTLQLDPRNPRHDAYVAAELADIDTTTHVNIQKREQRP